MVLRQAMPVSPGTVAEIFSMFDDACADAKSFPKPMPTPVINADFMKSRLDFILYVLFEKLRYFLVWLLIITVI
jgi:hypothetical protein